MPAWISNIFVALLTKLASWLFAKGLEKYHSELDKAETNKDIDERLKTFKEAYAEAFNGEPVTPEQRKKLNAAIADFIRGNSAGGL